MNTVRFFLYAGMLVIAYAEENDIPLIPAFWHYLTRFFSWLSGAAWRAGLASQHHYSASMENYRG